LFGGNAETTSGTVIVVWLVNWAGHALSDELDPRRRILAR
jgi:hypothetical protein